MQWCAKSFGETWLTAQEEPARCEFCHRGQIEWRLGRISFRQWSDKGYVHCNVEIQMGICDRCGAQTLPPDADRILDEEFQREYTKL
jgi:hypothetical protein